MVSFMLLLDVAKNNTTLPVYKILAAVVEALEMLAAAVNSPLLRVYRRFIL
jgi:hypothetical protein